MSAIWHGPLITAQILGAVGGSPPAATAPVKLLDPVIYGEAGVGNTLIAGPGSYSGYPSPSVTREWRRDGVAVSTGTSYTQTALDVGKTITYAEKATNASGNTGFIVSNAIGPVPAVPNLFPAPVLSNLSTGWASGQNPPSWQSKYGGAIIYDAATNSGDKVRCRWRINGGAWTTEVAVPLDSDNVLNENFAWPLLKARGAFASGGTFEAQEQIARFSNGSEIDTSDWSLPWTDVLNGIAADTAPDAFTFPNVANVALGSGQTSDYVTPVGYDAPAQIDVTNGEYQIESGAWSTATATISPGQKVRVRHTASATNGADTTTVLTIGGVSGTFKSTTINSAGYDIILMVGDSYTVGVVERDPVVDTAFPGSYQYRSYAGDAAYRTIDANTVPYSQQIAPVGGQSKLSPGEYLAKAYAARTGRKCLVIPMGYNGSKITSGAGGLWAVGNSLHEAAVAQANAAITAAKAQFADSQIVGIFQWMGANDMAVPATRSDFATKLTAAIADFRSRITGAASTWYAMGGILPEQIATANQTKFAVEFGLQDVHKAVSKVLYVPCPEGFDSGDKLHASLAGSRWMGAAIDAALADAVAPTITTASTWDNYAGNKLRIELTADKYASWTLSGPDASKFEVFEEYYNYGASAVGSRYYKVVLRWAADATRSFSAPVDANGDNSYEVTLNAIGSNGKLTTKAISVRVQAAYGTSSDGPVEASFQSLYEFSSKSYVPSASAPVVLPPQQFGAGLNIISWTPNGAWTGTTRMVINGVDAVQIDATMPELWSVTLATAGMYSPNLYGTGSAQSGAFSVMCLRNTVATPSAFDRLPSASRTHPVNSASLTCPVGGIVIAMGSLKAGNALSNSGGSVVAITGPTASGNWQAYRTNTGGFTITGTTGFCSIFSAAYARAP